MGGRAGPGAVLLALLAGPAPLLCQDLTTAQFERLRQVCQRAPDAPAARRPHDLGETLGPILRGEAFLELGPRVLSTDPWVIVFDRFLSEEEMVEIDDTLFDMNEAQFKASSVGDGVSVIGQARYSETAFCTWACDRSAASQLVQARAGSIVRTPVENIDPLQLLRYRSGMSYRRHHDNHPPFKHLPCGSRTFTFFVYLSDVEEGGGTHFPVLNLTVQPRRGRAVLFQNTLDGDPTTNDDRTAHEGLPVISGLKRGLNVWLYQYSFKDFWARGCTQIAFADILAGYRQPSDAPPPPKVYFRNLSPQSVEVFWAHPDTGEEVRLLALGAGESKGPMDTHAGHRFVARLLAAAGSGAPPVGSYTATTASSQAFDIVAAAQEELEL